MDPKLIAEALDALIAGDDAKCAEILKGLIAAEAGTEITEPPGTETPAAMAAPVPPEKEQAATMAAASLLMRLSGKPTIGESVSEAQAWHRSHLELGAERTKLAQERGVLEASERDGYGVEMVARLSEEPWRVWEEPLVSTDPAKRKLAEPLASMPIAQLRAHMAKLRVARAGKIAAVPPVPPPAGAGDHGLSASEMAACSRTGCEPAVYAQLKTQQTPRA